jgi:hypothetical protein
MEGIDGKGIKGVSQVDRLAESPRIDFDDL